MTTLLQLHEGKKSFGSRDLFEAATFAVNEGEHIGVIGPNGAGKSTLFKILVGQEQLDGGSLIKSRQLHLGYLPQHDDWNPTETVEHFLTERCEMPIWELKSIGNKLGLNEEKFSRPVTELSGGYRMRVKLLFILGQYPNVLLLDEPTNYLDLETLIELEQFLLEFKGAVLLISHDREFLMRVTDHTLEVDAGNITKFNGNIEDYFEQKDMIRDQLERTAANQAVRRAEIQKFIDRFKAKASKAKQAQSRMKLLSKMETIEVKPLPSLAAIPIPPPDIRQGKNVFSMEHGDIGYGTRTILSGVEFHINSGMKIAVVGLNGAGKTTLLKALAGELPLLKGTRKLGHEVTMGYYAQHVHEALKPENTVYKELELGAARNVLPQEILNLAGALLFSGNDVDKKVRVLSGGEKARVALGKILLGRHPFLVLDEPTNHLDFYTVEAMTKALVDYKGTVVAVSHDRSFVRRLARQIIEVEDGQASMYPGNYDEYLWSLSQRLARRDDEGMDSIPNAPKVSKPAPSAAKPAVNSSSSHATVKVADAKDSSSAGSAIRTGQPQDEPAERGVILRKSQLHGHERKEAEKSLKRLTRKIEENEMESKKLRDAISQLAASLESPHVASKDRVTLSTDIAYKQKMLDELEAKWLELAEEREKLEKLV